MTGTAPPLPFIWTEDEVFVPATPMALVRCQKTFAIGARYMLAESQERSGKHHRYFFAALNEAFQNLPADRAAQFPSMEHLRRYALIKAGYCDSHVLVCDSEAEAEKVAKFMEPLDEYGIVLAKGDTVVRYTAKSQNYRSMNKEDFRRSAEAVLDVVSSMIGLSREQLEENAGRSA